MSVLDCANSNCLGRVRKQLNPRLEIDGILLTMVNDRTNYAKDIIALLGKPTAAS